MNRVVVITTKGGPMFAHVTESLRLGWVLVELHKPRRHRGRVCRWIIREASVDDAGMIRAVHREGWLTARTYKQAQEQFRAAVAERKRQLKRKTHPDSLLPAKLKVLGRSMPRTAKAFTAGDTAEPWSAYVEEVAINCCGSPAAGPLTTRAAVRNVARGLETAQRKARREKEPAKPVDQFLVANAQRLAAMRIEDVTAEVRSAVGEKSISTAAVQKRWTRLKLPRRKAGRPRK